MKPRSKSKLKHQTPSILPNPLNSNPIHHPKPLHKPPYVLSQSKMAPLIFLLLFLSTTTFSSATTRLFLPLTHTHTHTPGPTHHLLKSSSLRSSNRFRTRHHPHKQQQEAQISLPLASGSDYTLTLSLSPTTSVSLYMDTGSDLVWFPCAPFQCVLCEGKGNANVVNVAQSPPPDSRPVSCFDPACSAAHSPVASSDLCAIASCPLADIETSSCSPSASLCPRFYYAYGDGSLTANLRRGPLSLLSSSSSSLPFPNFTFACAHSALAEPVGVAGFGRGILSLPNQLASLSPSLAARFSYCLVSHSFQSHRLALPSPLILGRLNVEPETPFVYTPMLRNPKYPYFYSVGLVAVSVGAKRIDTRRSLREVDGEGNGGMVVDSGTTFTMLPSDLYAEVSGEFGRRMKGMERAVEVEGETGLSPCFYYEGRNGSRTVPGLGLHFGGGASVALPKRNYFMGFERRGKRVGCLMLMDAGPDSGADGGGPAGTLGNFQQQGFEVVYDLEEGKVGFARRRCAALWDALSRG